MHKYEVTKAGYVPVGPGLKFKKPGQVVTLDDVDAAGLSDYVKRVDAPAKSKRSKVNTPDVDLSDLPTGTPVDGALNVDTHDHQVGDERTDSEREADEQAALARAQLADSEGVQN